jgi:uncharacterized membrane protein
MTFLVGSALGPGRLEWAAPPSVLALAIGGALVAWVLAWWTGRDARGSRRLELALWALAVVTVAAALARPRWVEERGREEPGRVVALVDSSASMAVLERNVPRHAPVPGLLADLGASIEVYHFDSDLHLGPPTTYDGGGTDLAAALQAVADRYAGQQLQALAIVTDGIDRGSLRDSLEATRSLQPPAIRAPVTIYQVGSAERLHDAAIDDVVTGGFAFLRTPFTLTVKARGRPGEQHELTLWREGRAMSKQTVALDPEGRATAEFHVTPTQVGRFAYEVSLPVSPDDAVPGNNSFQVVVRVVRDRTRVLQVCGSPSYDQKFLRLFLKEDPSIDLVSFFILRTEDDLGAGWRTQELSLIQFPYERLFSQDLETFDLVILQNFDYAPYFQFDPDVLLENVASYVRQGGALVMTGGDRSFDLGQYGRTPLADVLPVELGVVGPSTDETPFQPALSARGLQHPITRLAATDEESRAVWDRLPPLDGLNLVVAPKKDAAVLLEHPTLRTQSGTAMPVIAVREVDQGRTMALAVDASWRWSFTEAAVGRGNQAYLRFWKNSLRWLVADPEDRRVVVSPARENVLLGDDARLVVRVRVTGYGPVAGATVRGVVPGPGGGDQTFEVVTDAQGEASTTLHPERPGAYRVRASIGASEAESAETVFAVLSRDPELDDILPDGAFLQALATSYGGTYYAPGAWGKLVLDETAGRVVDERKDVDLAATPLVALLAGVLASGAWTLRRRAGAR